jgi:hypothetical protein
MIFIFFENGGINKSHGITFNNNFIKLFIVGRAKTIIYFHEKVENRNVVDNPNIPNVLNYPNVLNDQMF